MKRVIIAVVVTLGIWFPRAWIWHYVIESRFGEYWWNWPWYGEPLLIASWVSLVLIMIGTWIWAASDG